MRQLDVQRCFQATTCTKIVACMVTRWVRFSNSDRLMVVFHSCPFMTQATGGIGSTNMFFFARAVQQNLFEASDFGGSTWKTGQRQIGKTLCVFFWGGNGSSKPAINIINQSHIHHQTQALRHQLASEFTALVRENVSNSETFPNHPWHVDPQSSIMPKGLIEKTSMWCHGVTHVWRTSEVDIANCFMDKI